MTTKSKIHQAHLNEWATLLADHKASGLSVTEWCKLNNTTIHKYFYWKRLLKDEAVNQLIPDIVPVSLPSFNSPAVTSDALSPQVQHSTCTSWTSCSCARISMNGISIDIDSSASEDFITSLIKAVRYA